MAKKPKQGERRLFATYWGPNGPQRLTLEDYVWDNDRENWIVAGSPIGQMITGEADRKQMVRDMIVTAIVFYFVIAAVIFLFHMFYLQMVTLPLAALRSIVWPVYWMTGWPHGVPLPMD